MSNPNFGRKGVGGLYVDLVPSTAWYSNLRSILPAQVWKTISSEIAKHASYTCEICGGKGERHPVEAHERWDFNPATRTQTLVRIESLCPRCHQATHFGFAQSIGKGPAALKRLCYVNGWDQETAQQHVNYAFITWQRLSEVPNWQIDLSWLLNNTGNLISETTHAKILETLGVHFEPKSHSTT